MQQLFDEVAEIRDVTRVQSPYTQDGARQIATEGPEAGQDRLRERGDARRHQLPRAPVRSATRS